MAYTALDADRATIEVLTLADRHRKVVVRGGTSAQYVATSNGIGHLVYTNKATLFAVPFDLDKLETRGTAVPILDDAAYEVQIGAVSLSISSAPSGHGTLIYCRGSASVSSTMTVKWVDPTGKNEPLRAKPGVYAAPNLSPDGKRIVMLVTESGSQDVWVYDQQRDAMTRLTFGGAVYTPPIWSPNGQRLAFGSIGNGILSTRADGASQPQALLPEKKIQAPWSFTPDGKRLAYIELAGGHATLDRAAGGSGRPMEGREARAISQEQLH